MNLSTTNSKNLIRDKVMVGSNVTIMGGGHRFDVLEKYIYNVKEKRPEDEKPVTIESDIWIGANAIILKGETIKKGAVVAAGSIRNTIQQLLNCINNELSEFSKNIRKKITTLLNKDQIISEYLKLMQKQT